MASNSDCPFLDKVPLEVRTQIYKELLGNKILGTADSVSRSASYGADTKYGLYPQVLRVCHQIYVEALDVLYKENTFYIACFRVDNHLAMDMDTGSDDENPTAVQYVEGPLVELCPLTRYQNNQSRMPFPIPNLGNYTTVSRVRKWRVVVSRLTSAGGSWDPIWSLRNFCEVISQNPPISLELLILPCGLDYGRNNNYSFDSYEQILKPLRILRNIQTCAIKEARATDVPDIIKLADDGLVKKFTEGYRALADWELPTDLKTEIETLTTGQQPLDIRHMMHKNLVAYARTFERHRPYKMQMGLRREDITRIDSRCLEYAEFLDTGSFNPFIEPTLHPLEFELRNCQDAVMNSGEDEWTFKEHRKHVLTHLERQWNQIMNANHRLTTFIKKEKVPGGIFDAVERKKEQLGFSNNTWEMQDPDREQKICLALVYLKRYAKAFKRHLTSAIESQIHSQRHLYSSHYKNLPRDRLIKHLMKDHQVGKIRHFITKFSTAVDMCDQQYLEILTARKALFDYDGLGEYECGDFNLQKGLTVEMIDWSVNERDMTPQQLLNSDDFYGEDSDSESDWSNYF
ncbi:hypothetical protein BCON_0197g00070 [Botryotinia convoluta]|uniref:Uncharacterized protein n=1 Tax=Botryotinia convoluta TaxID=54673 RepID=A0A4Z1HM51_9HELO|nr:hypothetical protein BCON_0197g00070 [Botryotinia convoluta]